MAYGTARNGRVRCRIARALISAFLAGAVVAISGFGGSRAGEIVVNGGFETGNFSGGWVDGAGQLQSGQSDPRWADHMVVLDLPHSGSYSALIGFKYAQMRGNRYGYIYQDVAIPSNISSAVLSFKFRQQGWDGANYDPFRMQIRDVNNNVLAMVVDYSFAEANHLYKDSGWLDDDNTPPVGYSMTSYAGSTVRLYFYQENSFNNFYETWSYIDDVSLVYKRWIDLAVDGNGNDLFGNPGTGDGGSSIRSAETGETVSYILDLENEGADSDSYNLTVSPPPGWNVTLRYGGTSYAFPWTSPVIAAGSKITVEVIVSVPPLALVGGYATILDAVSSAFGNRYDSVRLGTNVVPADFLADLVIDSNGYGVIDPAGGGGIAYREALPNSQATYSIRIYNEGVQADSFQIWWAAAAPLAAEMIDGGTVHPGTFRTGIIGAGSSASYGFRVSVPTSLLGGDYTSFVYAKSLNDTLKKDGVRAITRVLAPKVDIIICGSGDDIIDPTGAGLGGSITVAGQRSTTIYFPFVIQNEGAVIDSFTLSWVSPGAGWAARVNDGAVDHAFPWTTPGFGPFSERNYLLTVTIPAGAAYDTYKSILNAVSVVSGIARESVSASVSVASGNEIDLIIDGNGNNVYGYLGTALGGSSVKTASPGDTVTFLITVENEGGENLFNLMWDGPPGWDVRIGDSTATMRRIPAGTYTLTVYVPAGCMGGTFDVVVDGQKTNKPYFVDSVRGRIIVAAPHLVDALIDGNGDDVLGLPGTGGGGSSTQSTIGGRTIRFTLELQNQGGEAESFRVTWNSFSGWRALLDGSPSPYTTTTIAAGASELFTLEVAIPNTAAEGDYDYIIDVVSTSYPSNVESVRGNIHINPLPRVDLIIDGNGAFDTAPAGTGEGGLAIIFGNPGAMITATLQVVNRGGFPDSFRVTWQDPNGWPSGSVLLSDGLSDYASPYVTDLIDPGASRTYTVKVFVPAGATLRSRCIMDAVGLSSDLEDSITLEIATSSFVTGVVFDDEDHDGLPDAGEAGWPNVTVELSDPGGPIVRQTDGAGRYLFEVLPGVLRQIIELSGAGMVSLSPDTVSLGMAAVGETLRVDFADVRIPTFVPSNNLNGSSGAFVDFAHTITAGTRGDATLSATLPAGWVAVYYRDNDGDGALSAVDSLLVPSDLALDPDMPGRDIVPIIAHVFIPPQVPIGTAESLTFTLRQVLSGTAIAVEVSVIDRILIIAQASGILRLVKDVDLAQAHPGDTITYTVTFSNPGTEGVREIEIIDPLSLSVDIVTDAFGPGQDIEWVKDGAPVYLTADPSDADEAMLEPAEGHLHFILSRRNPFTLDAGESGQLVYRVKIR